MPGAPDAGVGDQDRDTGEGVGGADEGYRTSYAAWEAEYDLTISIGYSV